MNQNVNDTIVAISTPPGQGAIGVIRLSGKDAFSIADNCFKGKKLVLQPSHTAHFGRVVENTPFGEITIDEVVITLFRGPTSYTGEDIVEISCHGSSYILQKILQILISLGARMANPGEFTLRAFLNGKMDLSQAEAVADLIASESQVSHSVAINQMRGGFSGEIKALRQELIDFAALLELELDFSEEDVEFADRSKLVALIQKLQKTIRTLMFSFELGNVIKTGIATVIAGRPNAGKSTLLNALLNEERAIVSDIAGTTRDTIEENMTINGLVFRFVDTAGIRESRDTIEEIGVKKALAEIRKGSLILYMADVSTTSPEMVWSDLEVFDISGSRFLVLLNKVDLASNLNPEVYFKENLIHSGNILALSALHSTHIDQLKDTIYRQVISSPEMLDQTIVANTRHYEALYQADNALSAVLNGIHGGISSDFIALDLRQALFHLGSITGEISSEDLLDSIFTRFCIGK
ncbi:MAG: tRNA uridine-5-carboxymethylaminomethyl(34) synthesis GTPase MnmE [Saprospiraceae bacterium]|nr:tRNA uridine-5-carboxymethylaminomethyl(34) synthesis GTPase MnmE [Saprospiraceae bacterium]